MSDKWILSWQITRYGASDEYDSFEEAKTAFRNKIMREIDIENYLDHMQDELDTLDYGEEISNFLVKFFENRVEDVDLFETTVECELEGEFNKDGFKMKESASYGLQTYPTIESNFIFMDDPDKTYEFYFNDPYSTSGIIEDFEGYDYSLTLKKRVRNS